MKGWEFERLGELSKERSVNPSVVPCGAFGAEVGWAFSTPAAYPVKSDYVIGSAEHWVIELRGQMTRRKQCRV